MFVAAAWVADRSTGPHRSRVVRSVSQPAARTTPGQNHLSARARAGLWGPADPVMGTIRSGEGTSRSDAAGRPFPERPASRPSHSAPLKLIERAQSRAGGRSGIQSVIRPPLCSDLDCGPSSQRDLKFSGFCGVLIEKHEGRLRCGEGIK